VLIDTPGMRELGAESADLEKTFDDIEGPIKTCRQGEKCNLQTVFGESNALSDDA